MLRRALLFVNPLSGKGKSKKCLLDVIRVFTEAGYSVRVYPTTPSREANIRFVQKNAKYNSLIVAIGGDGTLNELINGVMLSRIGAKIGFIPGSARPTTWRPRWGCRRTRCRRRGASSRGS